MHPTISREIRFYRTRISALNSCFFRILSLSCFTKIYFPIPFYAHLSYLSGIISRNILRRSAFETTIHIICIAFCLGAILPDIHQRIPSTPTIRIDVHLVSGTHRMPIIKNIIKAKTSTGIVTLVFDNQVFVDIHERLAVESVIIILILIALRQTAIQIGEDIQSPIAIIQIEYFTMIILMIALIGLPISQSQSFSLLSCRLDSDDRLIGCIVFCTRLGYHLYMFDVRRTQSVEFNGSLDFLVIDINQRFTFSQDFYITVLLHHSRKMFQNIFCRAHFLQGGSFYLSHQSFRSHSERLSMAFHYNFLQVHCCLFQSYCPYLTYIKGIACRNIAHATYSYYRLSRLAGNHELAVLIRHAAIYQ